MNQIARGRGHDRAVENNCRKKKAIAAARAKRMGKMMAVRQTSAKSAAQMLWIGRPEPAMMR